MKNNTAKLLFLALLMPALAAILFACAETVSMGRRHPTEIVDVRICSDCHTDGRSALNHTSDYITRHKFYAAQQKQTCEICHKLAFCADCHANKEDIKPSDKYKDSPTRALPHRGDYLSQHMIDGRMNPAACFDCHGRQNNERCRVCHK
jgi:hypothetical protein